MNQGPPPPGPFPSGPPPRPRPGAGLLVLAALLGLLVGVAVSLGVVALTAGDDDSDDSDLATACAAIEDVDADGVLDGDVEEGYRLSGAAGLFLAAGGGDRDTELGELGGNLQQSLARLDTDGLVQAVDDAQEHCDQR